MTFYGLMNKVYTLRFYMELACQTYREHKKHYFDYEQMVRSAFEALVDVGYLDEYDTNELREQMFHIMRMYKRQKPPVR